MNEGQIKVIYIAGPTRSGSTVLSNILGEIDGFFNTGELVDIWDLGLASNGLCGCGVQVSRCEVWSAVLDRTFRGPNRIDIQKMIYLRDSTVRSRYIPIPWLRLISEAKLQLGSHLNMYINNLERLYRAIPPVTQSKTVVDASKNPWYAYVLSMMPMIDLYIVHLIRDPRAVVYSWLRKEKGLRRINPIRSSLMWNGWNIVTEMLWRNSPGKYLKLYYEDFVAKPQETVKHILDLIQESPSHLPFVTEYEVKLGVNHSVYGNPNRFQNSGILRLQPDEEWKKKKKLVRILVTMLTWPLLIRYGYSGISRSLHKVVR